MDNDTSVDAAEIERISQKLQITQELTEELPEPSKEDFVTSAMDNWSKSLSNLTLPSDLVSECQIGEIQEHNSLFVKCVLLFGERTGQMSDIPYDGGGVSNNITDLSNESLWIYGNDTLTEIPSDFDTSKGLFSSKWKPFYIGTGKIRKCSSCRGRGLVKCSKCDGRGRYKSSDWDGNTVWRECSCGNGLVDCNNCSGYGQVQDAIKCKTKYRTSSESSIVYFGPDFDERTPEQTKQMIQNSLGKKLLEEVFDYPVEQLRDVATGGVDGVEYSQLQNSIKEKIKKSVHQKFSNTEHDVQNLYQALGTLLDSMPNPAASNEVLEHEILPVRIRFNVYQRRVNKVGYSYQNKNYSLFVYGNQGKVHAVEKPKEFTTKAKVASAIAGIVFISIIIATILSNTP